MAVTNVDGRIVYVEPNNFRTEMGGANFGNGDNISWNQEDLNINVDLQVIIPDRDGCGQYGVADEFTFNVSTNEKKNAIYKTMQSFMSGTHLSTGNNKVTEKSFLTTSYSDISYQEIKNSKMGGREALGIQSIDINFDANFFPRVKIRMIDVRGYSLFMPADHAYRDDKINEQITENEKKIQTCQNFFSALFHFPYPRFALSVKGFYGDRVTFMLAVEDFHSSFNSNTGNYEVEVDFIGHMYGLYSDLPLNYLIVAPYIGGSMNSNGGTNTYWKTQTALGGNFFYTDGVTPILTFIDFYKKYENIALEIKNNYANGGADMKNINEVIELKGEQTSLNSLLSAYKELVEGIGQGNNVKTIFDDKFRLYFSNESTIKLPPATSFNTQYDGYMDSSYPTKIEKPTGLDITDWGYTANMLKPLFKGSDESGYVIDKDHIAWEKIKDTTFANKVKEVGDELKKMNVYLFEEKVYYTDKLSQRINEIDSAVGELLKSASAEINEINKKALGFTPSIENVFRMIFAHLDAFMHSFYQLLSTINGEKGTRTLSSYGNYPRELTDIESNATSDCFIPPFTAFYEKDPKTKETVRRYPGELSGKLRSLVEIGYVEEIYNGIEGLKNEIGSYGSAPGNSTDIQDATAASSNWEIISPVDYFYSKNPYSEFAVDKGGAKEFVGHSIAFILARILVAVGSLSQKAKVDENTFVSSAIKKEVKNFVVREGNYLKDSAIKDELNEYANVDNALPHFKEYTKNKEWFEGIKKLEGITNETIPPVFYNLKKMGTEGPLETGMYMGNDNKFRDIRNTFPKCVVNDWGYPISNDFVGMIYRKEDFDIENKNGEEKWKIKRTKKAANRRNYWERYRSAKDTVDNYYFPLLQENNNDAPGHFFSGRSLIDDDTVNLYDKALSLLCCMVGSTELFPYTIEDAPIYFENYPKFLVLFLGGTKLLGEGGFENAEKDDSYINSKGISVYGKSFDNVKISNYTTSELPLKHAEKYFKEWVDTGGFKNFYNSIINAINNDDKAWVSIDGISTECFRYDSEAERILRKFYLETVDVFWWNRHNYLEKSAGSKISEIAKELLNYSSDDAEVPVQSNISIANESIESRRLGKEELYYTLKNLYDKWVSTYRVNRFQLKSPNVDRAVRKAKTKNSVSPSEEVTEFQNFIFTDTFFNDISDVFMVNPTTVYDIIKSQYLDGNNRSVLQAIADIAQHNKLLFKALPVYNNFYDSETIANIFTPHNIYDGISVNTRGVGSTYVLMYTHKPSNKIATAEAAKNGVGYKNDSFDIADVTGKITPEALNAFDNGSFNGENYMIPAFGVTFAKQNQMYFKSLSLNMDNPRETDYSIYNRFLLANQNTEAATYRPIALGQNMFSVYSNRVYDCTVEMMGCMNIMPMMYFQLNNVPMFRGAYRIINVSHHIESGSITTKFTGTRVSKIGIPFAESILDVETLIDTILQGDAGEGAGTGVLNNGDITDGITYTGFIDTTGVLGNTMETFEGCTYSVPAVMKYFATPNGVYVDKHKSSVPLIPDTLNGSKHICAAISMRAIKAGLINKEGARWHSIYETGCDGYKCSTALLNNNFKKIAGGTNQNWNRAARMQWVKDNAIPGDVCIMQDENRYGHICVFCGDHWQSDYNQTELSKGHVLDPYVYGKRNQPNDNIEIYRYDGPITLPQKFHMVELSNRCDKEINLILLNDGVAGEKESGETVTTRNYHIYSDTVQMRFRVTSKNGEKLKKYNISLKYGEREIEHEETDSKVEWTYVINETETPGDIKFTIEPD